MHTQHPHNSVGCILFAPYSVSCSSYCAIIPWTCASTTYTHTNAWYADALHPVSSLALPFKIYTYTLSRPHQHRPISVSLSLSLSLSTHFAYAMGPAKTFNAIIVTKRKTTQQHRAREPNNKIKKKTASQQEENVMKM